MTYKTYSDIQETTELGIQIKGCDVEVSEGLWP